MRDGGDKKIRELEARNGRVYTRHRWSLKAVQLGGAKREFNQYAANQDHR